MKRERDINEDIKRKEGADNWRLEKSVWSIEIHDCRIFSGGRRRRRHGADKTNEEVLNVVTSRSIINRSFSRSMSRNVPFEPPLSKRECTGKEKFRQIRPGRKSIHRIRAYLSEFSTYLPPSCSYLHDNVERKLKINIWYDLLGHKLN